MRTIFSGGASFNGTIFSVALFIEAIFKGSASFRGANFNQGWFYRPKFEEDMLTFRDATFILAKDQEVACRIAKNILAKAGKREEEEYYFYREMEAKRIQKGNRGNRGNSGLGLYHVFFETDKWSWRRYFWYDGIEWLFVQAIFGYGVHPRRVIVSWFSVIVFFSFIYWAIDGMNEGLLGTLNYIEGSFATAIAPGYITVIINSAKYTPIYHVFAIFETIIGTFLWAGFIATFAKRYMK